MAKKKAPVKKAPVKKQKKSKLPESWEGHITEEQREKLEQ